MRIGPSQYPNPIYSRGCLRGALSSDRGEDEQNDEVRRTRSTPLSPRGAGSYFKASLWRPAASQRRASEQGCRAISYTKSPTPSLLHQVSYTKSPTPSLLHQVSYTKSPTPSLLHQVAEVQGRCSTSMSNGCIRIQKNQYAWSRRLGRIATRREKSSSGRMAVSGMPRKQATPRILVSAISRFRRWRRSTQR